MCICKDCAILLVDGTIRMVNKVVVQRTTYFKSRNFNMFLDSLKYELLEKLIWWIAQQYLGIFIYLLMYLKLKIVKILAFWTFYITVLVSWVKSTGPIKQELWKDRIWGRGKMTDFRLLSNVHGWLKHNLCLRTIFCLFSVGKFTCISIKNYKYFIFILFYVYFQELHAPVWSFMRLLFPCSI